MKEKVLITGANGFLGFHLIESALARNLEVYAAVRKSSDIKHLEHLPIQYVYLDYNNTERLASGLREGAYDYIIHAAGLTKAKSLSEYNQVNVDITVNLSKAIQESVTGFKKLVFLSSLAAVGPLNNSRELITEDTKPKPVTQYGKSKLMAEQALESFQLPLTILRPTAVYGPREKDIFIILKTIRRGIDAYIGKIQQQLSFVHARDVADLAISSLFMNANGIYNISDGQNYSRYDLADITKSILKKKAFRIHLPVYIGRMMASVSETTYSLMNKVPVLNKEKLNEFLANNWVCDISKAKKELEFKPGFNLQNGLEQTIAWYKEHKWLR